MTYDGSGASTYQTAQGRGTGIVTTDDADHHRVQSPNPDGGTAAIERMPAVIVVDDDRQAREAVGTLLRTAGFESKGFTSATEFMAYKRPDAPCCLILEVRLRGGTNGLSLHRDLIAAEDFIPTIFITAKGATP